MFLSNSELKQLDLLKKKTPQERFMMMVQLINAQLEAIKAGIRYKYSNISEEELKRKYRDKMFRIYNLRTSALDSRESALRI